MANVDDQPPPQPQDWDVHKTLLKSRVGADLQEYMQKTSEPSLVGGGPLTFEVIIEFNANFPGGVRAARAQLLSIYGSSEHRAASPETETLDSAIAQARILAITVEPTDANVTFAEGDELDVGKSVMTQAYAFGRLTAATIASLSDARMKDPKTGTEYAIVHKIWRDHPVSPFVYASARTIKCDAARIAFGSAGEGVIWAVADTGIAGDHPHFRTHETLSLPNGLRHYDFTLTYADIDACAAAALTDTAGHGTHVAGIIAGQTITSDYGAAAASTSVVETIEITQDVQTGDQSSAQVKDTGRNELSGMAPRCKLMSLKVLNSERSGNVSNILAAIGYIQQLNDHGRDINVHGLNMSLGYPFNASWFAAGQSPLCAEVDRLVKCGVVVVVAAGNAGYGVVTASSGMESAALTCTLADPGNADLAITVGSTHRDRPHTYGVSYFSAKGPTADGRMKPDIVAPGERIVSCSIDAAAVGVAKYREDSGTSMAAPHVSGAVAAFLSVRSEFVGQPEAVKAILLGSAMSLGRRPEFQGAGLVDLMKALQSV